MDGYTFAKQVFDNSQGDVWPLIEEAGGGECEWLELKAGTLPRDNDADLKKWEDEGDVTWKVMAGLFALVNSTGGALILGLSENKTIDPVRIEPVDLDTSVPGNYIKRGDRDGFELELVQQLYKKNPTRKNNAILSGVWTGKSSGTWASSVSIREYFETHWGYFRNENAPVFVILVRPAKRGEEVILEILDNTGNPAGEKLLVREKGARGEVLTLGKHKERTKYQQDRIIERPALAVKWEEFERRLESKRRRDEVDQKLEDAIRGYAKTAIGLRGSVRSKFVELSGKATSLASQSWSEWEDAPDLWHTDDPSYDSDRSEGMEVIPKAVTAPRRGAEEFDSDEEGAGVGVPEGVLNLLARHERCVLLGESGSGKSTSLSYLVVDWASQYSAGGRVTMYAPLTAYRGELWGMWGISLSTEQLRSLAHADRLTMLLDGLDECPPNLVEALCRQIRIALADFDGLRLVLTSRPGNYNGFLGAPIFELEPMDEHLQKAFISKRVADQERVAAVSSRLRQLPAGSEMSSSPLLLNLLIDLAQDTRDIPRTPTQLFQEFIRRWYKREHDKRRRLTKSLDCPTFEQRLAALAFASMLRGFRGSCEMTWAKSEAAKLSGATANASEFVDWVADGLLLSVESTDDIEYLRFINSSFQEYLAAYHLLRNPTILEDADFNATRREQPTVWNRVFCSLLQLDKNNLALLRPLWRISPLLCAVGSAGNCPPDWPGNGEYQSDWELRAARAFLRVNAGLPVEDFRIALSGPPAHLCSLLRSQSLHELIEFDADNLAAFQRFFAFCLENPDPWSDLLKPISNQRIFTDVVQYLADDQASLAGAMFLQEMLPDLSEQENWPPRVSNEQRREIAIRYVARCGQPPNKGAVWEVFRTPSYWDDVSLRQLHRAKNTKELPVWMVRQALGKWASREPANILLASILYKLSPRDMSAACNRQDLIGVVRQHPGLSIFSIGYSEQPPTAARDIAGINLVGSFGELNVIDLRNLVQRRLLSRSDFSATFLRSLTSRISFKEAVELGRAGILCRDDLPTASLLALVAPSMPGATIRGAKLAGYGLLTVQNLIGAGIWQSVEKFAAWASAINDTAELLALLARQVISVENLPTEARLRAAAATPSALLRRYPWLRPDLSSDMPVPLRPDVTAQNSSIQRLLDFRILCPEDLDDHEYTALLIEAKPEDIDAWGFLEPEGRRWEILSNRLPYWGWGALMRLVGYGSLHVGDLTGAGLLSGSWSDSRKLVWHLIDMALLRPVDVTGDAKAMWLTACNETDLAELIARGVYERDEVPEEIFQSLLSAESDKVRLVLLERGWTTLDVIHDVERQRFQKSMSLQGDHWTFRVERRGKSIWAWHPCFSPLRIPQHIRREYPSLDEGSLFQSKLKQLKGEKGVGLDNVGFRVSTWRSLGCSAPCML